jgi:hypothetical protein
VPYTPGMKGKMKLARGLYIDERVTSHKLVDSAGLFPLDESVAVAILLESPSIEVLFVTNRVLFVTNKVYFVTNKVCFVTNKVCFVTNKHCFAAKQHSFLTKKLCFVTETLTNIDC